MTSLAKLPELVGFFSYSRNDDQTFGNNLSKLRERISGELGALLGREIRLWQDTAAIPYGALWKREITEALAESVFFIPIVTPRAIASPHCQFEFDAFLEREKELLRSDLVFPILYIRVPTSLTEDAERRELWEIIRARQFADWTKIRNEALTSPAVSKEITHFCESIAKALEKPWLPPEARRSKEEAEMLRVEREHGRKPEAETSPGEEQELPRLFSWHSARRGAFVLLPALALFVITAWYFHSIWRVQSNETITASAEPSKIINEVIAATTDRDELIRLMQQNTQAQPAVEDKLRQLGYLQVSTAKAGNKWLKPGEGSQANDQFKDCGRDEFCPEMVVLPPGKFPMGSAVTDGRPDERPQHTVTIGQPFAVGKFEVTFNEWEACVRDAGCASNTNPNDEGWGKGKRPVINVSWRDATEYVNWLKRKTDKNYRLITEAEWEYAARAATLTKYAFGDTINRQQAQFSAGRTAEVGTFPPNKWGLHDMHGNVWEWVQDCYVNNYFLAPSNGLAAPLLCSTRVLRGGSWDYTEVDLRSARRESNNSGVRRNYIGFRVARAI